MNSETEKAIDRIKKLRRQAESEAALGNYGTAELFREKADEQIIKFSITEEMLVEIVDAKFVNELGKSVIGNPFTRANAKVGTRLFWFESLTEIVAHGYNCKSEIDTSTGNVILYGYDLDREITIFMLLKLAEISDDFCKREMSIAKSNVGKPPIRKMFGGGVTEFPKEWMGDDVFTDSFHLGFRNATKEVYKKHSLDEDKAIKVDAYFKENRKSSATDWMRPRISAILNADVEKLGYIAGTSVNKKARNAPSALATRTTNGSSAKIIDADTIYLCIDDSGSMHYNNKIQQAKDGAIAFAEKAFSNGKAVGLIKFGDSASHVLRPQTEMSERFVKAIEKLSARGATTDMHLAIAVAQAKLLNRKRKRTICIVTDGMPSNKTKTLQNAADAKRDGIEIAVIGTDDADKNFLDQLCSRAGLGILVERNQLALSIGEMANKL